MKEIPHNITPMQNQIPELLMPAGNMSKLKVALAYGADAVYVGASGLSMRPDDASMSPDQLAGAVDYAHSAGKRLYVGVNTLVTEGELDELRSFVDAVDGIPFDAVIVADLAAFTLFRERYPDLRIHISTQLSTANSLAAGFWKDAGCSRIVLARECTLEDASSIASETGLEVEIFGHGAMCVAVSGRCLISAATCGHSASKGHCKHSCRWNWSLVEEKRPGRHFSVVEVEKGTFLMGSKDLCLIEHIPAIVKSGISSIKVEGRMKGEFYVATVARTYRAALDLYASSPESWAVDPGWMRELTSVSHRPHSTGFAFGYPQRDPASLQTTNMYQATHDFVGVVNSLDGDVHTIDVKNVFSVGEELEWIGPSWTGGYVKVAEILFEDESRERSHCGTIVQVRFEDGTQLNESSVLRRLIKDREE